MKRHWTDIGIYMTGSVLFALSVIVFSTPNNIAPGGASGVAIMLNTLAGIPVGTGILLINMPLLAAAFFKLSRIYAVRSAVAILISSAVMDVMTWWVPPFTGERVLAALFGGLLQGIGIGMIILRGASTGGTEIAAQLLRRRKPHMSAGRMMMVVDAVVVGISAIVFGDVSAALYAAIQVFVCAVTIDHVLSGREEGKLVMAVTVKPKELCRAIGRGLSRGTTVLSVRGGYTDEERAMVLCAVSRVQLPFLRELVHRVDREAFLMVLTTEQVVGEGFLPHGKGMV